MSNCDKHKRTVDYSFGYDDIKIDNMQELAEKIGDLHYETLEEFLVHLSNKLSKDSIKDWQQKRYKLEKQLHTASLRIRSAAIRIGEAWKISKPYMENDKNGE